MAKTAADLLKQWLAAQRLSQAECARRLGVSRVTVSNWSRGQQRIPRWLPLALRGLGQKLAEEQYEGLSSYDQERIAQDRRPLWSVPGPVLLEDELLRALEAETPPDEPAPEHST